MTVAYQLTSVGTSFTRTTVERRPLGPRDVHLDLQFCGICHSDLVAASNKLGDRKSTRLDSSHSQQSRMPSSA